MISLLLAACSKRDEKLARASQSSSEFAVSVKTAPVVRRGIKSTIRVVGAVKAPNQATISAKIPGKLERILADVGDRVEAGQTLVQIERTDLELTVRQAEAAVAVAEANFYQAKTEWERCQELCDKGIASRQQYDLAKSAFDVAEASVKQAKADLGLAKHQLENADVTTLFGGVVTHKYVNIGERVSPGQPLLKVAQIDPVEVTIGVSDKRFSELKLGQPVIVRVDGYPGEEFVGTVTKIQPAVDPTTRTFTVTAEVANSDERLKPGMFARAEIEVGYRENALVMPKAATLEEEGRYFAVAVKNDRARRTAIELGYQDGDLIEIVSGLSEGELVVLEGAYALAEGAPVQVSGE